MDPVLLSDIRAIQSSSVQSSGSQSTDVPMPNTKDIKSKAADEFYDDIYFDSDEDEDISIQQDASSKNTF